MDQVILKSYCLNLLPGEQTPPASEVIKLEAGRRNGHHDGTLLRIIDDAHQMGQSIIICAFTSLPNVAVSVDSSGSAYEMDFR